jgi:hypothetical protein
MDLERVQPVQSLTPDGPSRARSVLTMALPLVALVAVVLAGVAGRSAEDRPDRVAEATSPSSPRTSAPRPTPPEDLAALAAAGFPTDTIGLPVRSVGATLERHRGGRAGEGVIAVAGWLTVPPEPDCALDGDPARENLLCRRDTMLVDDPQPVLAVEGDEVIRLRTPGAHLNPQAMPGISLDAIADHRDRSFGTALRPVPVIVVGRFGDPRLPACGPSPPPCVDGFAIERLIWVDGDWQLRRPGRFPGLADVRISGKVLWYIINEAFQHPGVVLSEVLIPRDALKAIDPIADGTVDPEVSGPVWYIRTMIRSAGGVRPSDVGWAVIEDASGIVLGVDPTGGDTQAAD